MAHVRASETIFSPSVARLASSAAKDWNYVDSWLSSKFEGRPSLAFERNPETLKALVALAALNETADEERDLVISIETTALEALAGHNAAEARGASTQILTGVTAAVEQELPRDGLAALDSMAAMAVELGVAYPDPEVLGHETVQLQARLYQLEQATKRTAAVQSHVEEESARSGDLLGELDDGAYRPAADLAKANLELQRKVKTGTVKLLEMKEKAAKVADKSPDITLQQVQDEESLYRVLLSRKRGLDSRIEPFQSLPPDKNLARQQLEVLRKELQVMTQKRDVVFEGLVDRETPRKPR
ncbi:hypothetical protein CMQ_1956 [Grosmannia clavigera kw1407]|uniref:HAUS augmin-like complex subunit 1 n=1 Tax=Grosmannia clavigera (strain kw1407 / UAMH 11150) TaxID=655863 RepID=F0XNH8_GROCL|nr:uncharacterized protein CMQ_1956 [Grosmannia clavigera kw1407]EFX00875.1 hypothetical protein CMQ_1956 [Grosmannia clavigera kw1407]